MKQETVETPRRQHTPSQAQIVPCSVRRFRITTDPRNTQALAWCGGDSRRSSRTSVGDDVTYIPTREGWLYLAAVLDL